jgi:glycerophosphoryl diester phosphodiesterase
MTTKTAWPYPRVAAHRGGGKLAPENTLDGIDTGAAHGLKMVEFDAKLSADDMVFLLHDDLVDRTSNGVGLAKTKRYEALRTLDAGAWFGREFTGAWMPTLDEVAARCRHLQLAANVEIKPCEGRDVETGRRVARETARLWAESEIPPLLSSFSHAALEAAAIECEHVSRGMLYDVVPDDWRAQAERLSSLSLHANHKHLTEKQVDEIKSAGLYMLVYTVNDPDRARLLGSWGVDTICTDRIDLIGADFFV